MGNLYFAKHAKSSAAIVTIAIHAVIILVAFFFVAVTVIHKNEMNFEAKPVNRPKMKLRQLQVPVNVRKPPQQPKLRKQIVARPNVAKMTPDIKMPEIVGVKGGLGAGSGGVGSAASLGFTMPEINMFGIKGKGEKVFIALDSDPQIMRDEVGGIRAYSIIKDEVYKIISGLQPTALFNVAVYDAPGSFSLFPSMVSASSSNVAKVKAWLDPLNEVKAGMGAKDYGIKTLPPGGIVIDAEKYRGKYGKVKGGWHWYPPTALAMEQQADTVFILTSWWAQQGHSTDKKYPGMSESQLKRYYENLEKARELFKKENEERLARGEPPRVLGDDNLIVNAYFPDSGMIVNNYIPYHYTGGEMAEAIHLCRQEYASRMPTGSGLSKRKKKDDFSINVIYFAPADTGILEHEEINFKEFTQKCNGSLRVLEGLDAIESSVQGQGR